MEKEACSTISRHPGARAVIGQRPHFWMGFLLGDLGGEYGECIGNPEFLSDMTMTLVWEMTPFL